MAFERRYSHIIELIKPRSQHIGSILGATMVGLANVWYYYAIFESSIPLSTPISGIILGVCWSIVGGGIIGGLVQFLGITTVRFLRTLITIKKVILWPFVGALLFGGFTIFVLASIGFMSMLFFGVPALASDGFIVTLVGAPFLGMGAAIVFNIFGFIYSAAAAIIGAGLGLILAIIYSTSWLLIKLLR